MLHIILWIFLGNYSLPNFIRYCLWSALGTQVPLSSFSFCGACIQACSNIILIPSFWRLVLCAVHNSLLKTKLTNPVHFSMQCSHFLYSYETLKCSEDSSFVVCLLQYSSWLGVYGWLIFENKLKSEVGKLGESGGWEETSWKFYCWTFYSMNKMHNKKATPWT